MQHLRFTFTSILLLAIPCLSCSQPAMWPTHEQVRANPLKGISEFKLEIHDPAARDQGSRRRRIASAVKLRLRKHGLPLVKNSVNVLYIDVRVTEIPTEFDGCLGSLEAQFCEWVTLARGVYVRAILWEMRSSTVVPDVQSFETGLRNLIPGLIDDFSLAYLEANELEPKDRFSTQAWRRHRRSTRSSDFRGGMDPIPLHESSNNGL